MNEFIVRVQYKGSSNYDEIRVYALHSAEAKKKVEKQYSDLKVHGVRNG